MEDKLTTRNADGTFAPGNPGKAHGTLTKARRKLRELVEAEAGGDPLPVRMVRIAARAEAEGDLGLALTGYAAAAQYAYAKPKAVEVNEEPPLRVAMLGPDDPEPDRSEGPVVVIRRASIDEQPPAPRA